MEIVLTPEQKKEEINKRVNSFSDDLKKLIEKHQIDLVAEMQYQPNGVFGKVVAIDLKYRENK